MKRTKLTRSTWLLLASVMVACGNDDESSDMSDDSSETDAETASVSSSDSKDKAAIKDTSSKADTASEADATSKAQSASKKDSDTQKAMSEKDVSDAEEKASNDEAAQDKSDKASKDAAANKKSDSEYQTSSEDETPAIDPEVALAAIPETMRPKTLVPDLKKKLLVPDVDKKGLAMFTDIVTVEAGQDVTFCSYLPIVTDKLTYIHDTQGSQSRYGHHAILQYTTQPAEPGTRKCDPESLEAQQGQILGGTGGEGTSAIKLPPNVVSEIPAGSQFIINHHWINVGEEDVEVQAEMITIPPESEDDLVVARAFTVVTTEFDLPPNELTETSVTCMLDHDVQLLTAIGHQHSWGTHVRAERMSDGAEVIFDHDYDESMISHPLTTSFTVDEPLVLKAGDGIRMNCQWMNTTDQALTFPREMCVFFGWQIGADQDTGCANGNWRH